MNYLLQPIIQIEDSNGKPLVGGKVYVYKHGITPPVLADTYSDFSSHLNTNPIILDSLGHCTIIAEADTLYDVIIKDSNDLLQFSIVNASVIGGSGDITIENPPVEVKAGNGLKVDKTTLLDGTIQYKVSNNATNPNDKGTSNFVTGKDNYVESDYSIAEGTNNKILCTGNQEYKAQNIHVDGKDNNITLETVDKTYQSGYVEHSFTTSLNVVGDGNTVKHKGYCYSDFIFGQRNDVDYLGYSNFIGGNYNEVTNDNVVYLYDNIIYGSSNKVKGDTYANAIFGTYNECDSCSNVLVCGNSNKLKLSDPTDRYTNVDYSIIGGERNEAECMFGGVILGQDNKFSGNGDSHDTGFIIGQNNEITNGNNLGSYIFGINNKITGSNSHNFIFGAGNETYGYHQFCLGRNLKSNGNDLKITMGQENENKADTFLEIANGENVFEIKNDNTIYYKYNDGMVQLKPTTDNLVMVSVEAGQPEYKTFDEMLELITQGKYLVLVSGIPGAAFFFPVKSVSNDSIDFDGYDRIVSYKNDNTTEIIERNMVCVVDNVTERLSQSFENIKKCLDDNGSVVVKLDIVGYNMYALLRANAVTQDFILFSSTYIPNESTTPHTLTLKLNSDESIEFSEG